ncbi:MAG TPA: HAMP domain-containing sensor histidine kinase [Aggregicoccus sp.]|nr:HAMP domain-containing sensor histidine kinase [Aggregicoccus sp.]
MRPPLGHFVRARLHRRLFVWFGLSILVTGVVVAGVMSLFAGANSWRRDAERLKGFLGARFEEVWEQPAARAHLAAALARELAVDVELVDAQGRLLQREGAACPEGDLLLPVAREGRALGGVRVCYLRSRPNPHSRPALALLIVGGMLWLAAGKIARKLARPMSELVRATQELGAGNLSARAQPGRHASGEMEAVAAAFNDMAARIERQVADQRELLATVSHELRTPLGRLRVLAELLRDRGGDPGTVDQVDREVVELDALVGELLASSRLDFGQLSARPLQASDLAARALERASLSASQLSVETAQGALVGDATLLGRALANLLDNAQRHGGGARALRVKEHAGQLAFCVEDCGPGLAPGEETRIFEPFYRSAHGTEAGSLGLGLTLVQRIARAHGGEAYAENRPGGGACVGFTVGSAVPHPNPLPGGEGVGAARSG